MSALKLIKQRIKSTITEKTEAVIKLHNRPRENWHENFILHIASIIRPKVYVELGLYRCELFNRIIPFADRLIGVDFETKAGTFMKKTGKTEFVHSKSGDYAAVAERNGLQIDLLFIDANHSYESVHDDFKKYFPLVRDQGIILMHDGFPKNKDYTAPGYCGDGYKAIRELTQAQNGYEMMTLPFHPGLTLVRKRTMHLSWSE